MSRTRIRRKEIKQPDEFISLTTRTLHFVAAYPREFAWGAFAVGLFLAMAGGYGVWRRSQEGKAQVLLARGLQGYHKALQEGLGAPPTEGVRTELTGADQVFQEVEEHYRSTHASAYASLYRGYVRQLLGKPDEAVGFFETARHKTSKEPMASLAVYGIAKSFDLEGESGQAADYYASLSESEGSPLEEQATQDAVRCYMRASQRGKAQSLLSEAQARYPNTPWIESLRKQYGL